MSTFIERVTPAIETTIRGLAAVAFSPDPIVTAAVSRATSVVEAAFKRHGLILETALREALADCPRLTVWDEPAFKISHAAEHAATSSTEEGCRQTEMPYGDGETLREIQLDLVTYDTRDKIVRSYELKRGHGHLDAGKTRQTQRNLSCTQMLLRTYAEARDLQVARAEACIIFYYGIRSIRSSLVREDLDKHFGVPVIEKIELANALFKARLADLLNGESHVESTLRESGAGVRDAVTSAAA